MSSCETINDDNKDNVESEETVNDVDEKLDETSEYEDLSEEESVGSSAEEVVFDK